MQLLRPFDERELELIIGGLQAIDVQDWKAHTRLKHCTPETPQVQWFWLVSKTRFLRFLCPSENNKRMMIPFFLFHRPLNPIQRRCVHGCCSL